MAERIVREMSSRCGGLRVIVVRRDDGRFTYRRQERVGREWGPATIHAGVDDSPDTAETEARQRVTWLRDLSH